MVDIETMSTQPNAAIVSIGACVFDMYGQDDEASIRARPHEIFDVAIDLESCQKEGMHISAGTVYWWLRQSKEAQNDFLDRDIVSIRSALSRFTRWLGKLPSQPELFWANDPDFDAVILRTAFENSREFWSFKFWNTRSLRTTKHLAYPNDDAPTIGVGEAHAASDDAIKQVLMAQHCIAVLEGRVAPRYDQ